MAKVRNSVFENCSATDFGGCFSIRSSNCEIYKVCCIRCWLSNLFSFHNGNSGFLYKSNFISHILSTVIDCSPHDNKDHGYCVFAVNSSLKTVTKDVNASHGNREGYLLANVDECEVTYSTFDKLYNVCLYFHNVQKLGNSYCNILRHRWIACGALFGQSLKTLLAVSNLVFYDNEVDVYVEQSPGFTLYYCHTDKNSFGAFGAISCLTGIKVYSTYKLNNANGCYNRFEITIHMFRKWQNYIIFICLAINSI